MVQEFGDFKNLHSNQRKLFTTIDDHGKQITKKIPKGDWWIKHEHRRQYIGQKFMPRRDEEVVNETLNLFEGFAVYPRKPEGRSGASGCQLFLDHGLKIMCGGNEEHWDFLRKREALIAQKRIRSEIAVAFRTEQEGAGKGFWEKVFGRLYGLHQMQVTNSKHVIGEFNHHLETLLRLVADEALFVGDPRHRNALFSLITEDTLTIEPKFIGPYSAPNYLNVDITTNAKHFVPASGSARRFLVPTVSEERIGDFQYFTHIQKQLEDGGYEALLYHLLHEVDLRDFNARRVPKTAGLAEQQEMSSDSVTQWAQACVDADAIVGDYKNPGGPSVLDMEVSSDFLHWAYTSYCDRLKVRAVNPTIFGGYCAAMFGPRCNLKTHGSKQRPKGYRVSDGDTWQKKIDAGLGKAAPPPPSEGEE
jgi:hypothetical protein